MNIYRRRLRRLADTLALAVLFRVLYAAAVALDWQDRKTGGTR